MDSPPECMLAFSCEPPLSPPSMPSLDHSPQGLTQSPQSSPSSPQTELYAPVSPCLLPGVGLQDEEDEELSAPPSPTPAVALFPCELELGSPSSDSSPPATPSAPFSGFGALEQAISAGQSTTCNEELDLQLFNNEGMTVPGGTSSGPALKFPCHVCGKRFRFQSILSLHARAHSLDRDRRASAHYRTANAKLQQNHVSGGVIQNVNNRELGLKQSPLSGSLQKNMDEEIVPEEPLQTASSPQFLFEGTTALTPPLTEEAPISTSFSPLSHAHLEESTHSAAAPAFRCHACKGKFRTASELARHVRILHNPYKCTMCPFSASQEERLAAHLQESHPPEDPAAATVFPSLPEPQETPSPHMPVLPAFRCETCGQRFTQSWFLKGHMRKHKDSLDHKCQVCGRGFKEPWFLKNHMKVHLNKLGLKAGLGNMGPAGPEQVKGPASTQVLGALYSSLLLARSAAGGGGSGSRTERSDGGAGSSKSSILGYLGLPKDNSNGSCMERLQAVAQVAEMGNARGRGGEAADGADQAAMWQLVARSLAAAQNNQQQQQRSHSQHQPPSSRGTVAGEAKQMRAYLGGLTSREELEASGAPWECPDCGKLFRSLQQVVAHARVHIQKPQKGQSAREATLREENVINRVSGAPGRRVSDAEGRQEAKQLPSGVEAAGSFHSVISHLSGQNGLRGSSSESTSVSRERVRGTGMKDCPYCGKAFRSSHHLKVHLRVHTGERPYKCPHCDYAGTQSGSLKYHLQRHHREQRNAMATSPNSPSPNPSPLSSSPREGLKKHRRIPSVSQSSFGRVSGEASSSRHSQSWAVDALEKKDGSSGRQRDLKSQYHSLSGMMGSFFPGGLEAGWTGEAPPPKMPKLSRRKPLTTSRMVSANGYQGGITSSGSLEGGFEPLDLSRRPLQDEEAASTSGGGTSKGGNDILNQCVFCPFRTSSAELMAMHLQVNHTSKSRRKRDTPANRSQRLTLSGPDRDPLTLWKFLNAEDGIVSSEDWISSKARLENGVSPENRETEDGFDLAPEPPETFSATEKDLDDEDEEEDEEENDLEPNGSFENLAQHQCRRAPSVSSDLTTDQLLKEDKSK